MISEGDYILALDENKMLKVEGFWYGSMADFSAVYVDSKLVDSNGNRVFGNRGFKLSDEGTKWKRA